MTSFPHAHGLWRSLRWRLLAAVLAMYLLAALGTAVLTYRGMLTQMEALFDYQLEQMAWSLRDQGEVAPTDARALADARLDLVVQVWSPDGRGIYASRPHAQLPSQARLGHAEVVVDGTAWHTFSLSTPWSVVQVAQPLAVRQRLAAEAAFRTLLPWLVLVPGVAALMAWLVAWLLRPLQRVAQALQQRDSRSLQPLDAPDLPDEVAALVQALNQLMGRLGQALSAQQAFLADAAHELRSPLAALNLQLHVVRQAPDAQARDEALQQLADGLARTHRLVAQLLDLARAEPATGTEAPQPVDLPEVVRGALATLAPLWQARGAQVSFTAEAVPAVSGHAAELASLARNLIDNAVRHSPAGVAVAVSVRPAAPGDAPGVVLCVDDAGPGIPEAERTRVFERFYRRAEADVLGSGLGLAIVQAVAERHGARVVLGDAPQGGLRVEVHVPA
jgi:two-component system OmpR family sensor kinase/two-component system sensor histidine kinase QseC